MSGPSHKLYLDESGTKEYSEDGSYPPSGGRTAYFAFAGLLVTTDEAGRLTHALKNLKRTYLGRSDVEVKANWVKRPKEREARYLRPLGISEATLDTFIGETYALIVGMDGKLLASIVDKSAVQRMYTNPWYAPAIAYECLMQRAQLAMVAANGTVSVTIDDMDGATPKGNQYKDNLQRHHKLMRSSGSQLKHGTIMDRLADLSFSNSKSDERLQLADLVAYAVYRQFVDHGPAYDGDTGELPVYPYYGQISQKFRTGPEGDYPGYGLVKFPKTVGNRWVARKS